ncbi:sensor histidine kinase [Pseudobacteriovorax antillogorgiicola]|uniref:histidine kinase n=1 Tax=Pseudobacteriovorax antillogorgiicola TaxID=1513793 RepID=A0A1Y6C7Y7_9BACT|nr:ATP-binding protein [Pseudobacteriovorax antillogorgiicola]TCS51754.1 phospho-acceptor domain-containing protein [Pseudobacteriovorax antillogorgiicola]SMF49724.1 His Kinase A (phospho-acceptor) domain-containing protein [Pseudobacteriovorax antillogorgiicola]
MNFRLAVASTIQALVEAGENYVSGHEERERLKLLNVVCLLLASICFCYVVGLGPFVGLIHIIPMFLAGVLYLLAIYCNSRGFLWLGQQSAFFIGNVLVFIVNETFGSSCQTYLYYIVGGFFAFPLLNHQAKPYKIFWSGLSLSLLIICHFNETVFTTPIDTSKEFKSGLVFVSQFGVFLLSSILTWNLVNFNDRLFEEVRYQNNLLRKTHLIGKLGSFELLTERQTWILSEDFCRICGLDTGLAFKEIPVDENLIHPDSRQIIREAYISTRTASQAAIELEYQMVRADNGKIIDVKSFMDIERDRRGCTVKVLGIMQDITEEKARAATIKEQEAKILANSKLSSLGEMAAGVAHEINNPLAIISGKSQQLLQLVERKRDTPEMMVSGLSKIVSTAERIAKIIRGLRSFSRNSEGDPMEPFALSQILDETLALCHEKLKYSGVALEWPEVDGIIVECRPTEISQILMNLISNALSEVENHQEPWIRIECQTTPDRVDILIVDSGKGIPTVVQEKMMQPFFTTKELGQGTGLGLSISKGIADQHGGSLDYELFENHTCFRLSLPRKKQLGERVA